MLPLCRALLGLAGSALFFFYSKCLAATLALIKLIRPGHNLLIVGRERKRPERLRVCGHEVADASREPWRSVRRLSLQGTTHPASCSHRPGGCPPEEQIGQPGCGDPAQTGATGCFSCSHLQRSASHPRVLDAPACPAPVPFLSIMCCGPCWKAGPPLSLFFLERLVWRPPPPGSPL